MALYFNHGYWSNSEKPGGQVFFVSAGSPVAYRGIGGSDSNDGRTPQRPLSTVSGALSLCVSGRGDTIVLLPGTITVTAPISITVADVTLTTGCAESASYPYGPTIITAAATYDNNLIQVDADNVVIEGIVFECGFTTVTANQEVVQVNSTNTTTDISGFVMRNCLFDGTRSAGAANAADADLDFLRLGLDSNDRVFHARVENCVFTACDQDAIAIPAAPGAVISNCRIRDGLGSELTRYGISIASVGVLVKGCNITVGDTATPGAGIYVNSTLAEYVDNRIWARGADTIAILAAASATGSGRANWLTAVAAGNLTDYTTDNTSPSADANAKGIFAATPGAAAFETPTVGGA